MSITIPFLKEELSIIVFFVEHKKPTVLYKFQIPKWDKYSIVIGRVSKYLQTSSVLF